MFVLAIFLHVIFLFSIFDIYFKSPIVRNVVPYQPQYEAPADRLVLFVVDGLRAESFVNYTTMPYLRSVANTHGRWGISNTRMPTESRPGHVAVIAGFYEDPSAILKGWKENPVDFDSVFNQSVYTWSWGAYDIVEIFAKGDVEGHIFINKFDPYDQTFSTDKNTTLLDAWVFDNVKNFFNNAKHDPVLNSKLHEPKIVFFLHLLGTDTSGHTHKPKSPNFLTTVRFVDERIKQIEEVIRDFYSDDDRTTFLMTSDHGMTDWGSHGAGQDHETQTPYVLWGAGVQQVDVEDLVDPETLGMSLEHRYDINQADLAPLMSTVLSIPVPVNSVGKLTTELLNMTIADKAKAVYSNSRQLASQYDQKRQEVENNALRILYKPFEPFNAEKCRTTIEFTETMLENEFTDPEEWKSLILLSEEIMDLSLQGLDYYQNYYQKPLLVLVTLSFIGWILSLMKALSLQKMNFQTKKSSNIHKSNNWNENVKEHATSSNIVFSSFVFISAILVFAQNMPFQYYIYFLLPIFLWRSALTPIDVWICTLGQLLSSQGSFSVCVEALSYILGSFALGMSFTYRWMLSVPLLGMALWPIISSTRNILPAPILLAWPTGCILLSIFSFMPVVGKETHIELVMIAGLFWLIFLAIFNWKILSGLYRKDKETKKEILLNGMQMTLLAISLHNIYVQSERFDKGTPVSPMYQGLAWIIAVTSLVTPLAVSKRMICRLVSIYTSILNFYLLLSVSHEGLFMVTLVFNVSCWLFIEFKLLPGTKELTSYIFDNNRTKSNNFIKFEREISRQDFRRAFIFTSYIILAFFGTGNIASLNSFEVRWVTCFITSFKPFIILGLILLKTLSPFLSVACTFRAVQQLTKAPTGSLHIIVLIYSNIMGIQLLYYVKNYGSWLDIGTSISQFVIVQVITLFIVLINEIAKIITDTHIGGILGRNFKKYV